MEEQQAHIGRMNLVGFQAVGAERMKKSDRRGSSCRQGPCGKGNELGFHNAPGCCVEDRL